MNLSVFFPAYNEEKNIERTVRRALEILRKLDSIQKFEVLIIDDGSTDRTREVADHLAAEAPEVRVIHHPRNRGYGGALKSGFHSARFEWVCFTDSDGQFDFSEIRNFLAKKDEADLVLGYRLRRADSPLRRFFTWGWTLLARVLLGLSVRDYSCGFKLIKKEVFNAVQPLVGEEKVTQIELLVKARKEGFRFSEVGVHHYPRLSGRQTGANPKVVFRSLLDLFSLSWRLKRLPCG